MDNNNLINYSDNLIMNNNNTSQQKILSDEFEEIIPMQLLNEQQQINNNNNNNQYYNNYIKQQEQSYFQQQTNSVQQQQQQPIIKTTLLNKHNSPSFHHSPIQLFNNDNSPINYNEQTLINSNNNLMFGQQQQINYLNNTNSQQHFQQQQQQLFSHNQWQQQQQQQTYWQQIPPLRKESMPALHFNDYQSTYQQQQQQSNHSLYISQQNLINEKIIKKEEEEEQKQQFPPLNNNIRSHSTAIFCIPSPSSFKQQQQQNNNSNTPSPNEQYNNNNNKYYRRTKSIVFSSNNNENKIENSNNLKTSISSINNSFIYPLRRFNSQLRSPCHYSSTSSSSPGNLPPFKPYTPPPILSPMRQGSGLFNKISSTQQQKEFRKYSALASTLVYQSANNIGANGINKNCSKSSLGGEKTSLEGIIMGGKEENKKEMTTRISKSDIIIKEEENDDEEEEMRIEENINKGERKEDIFNCIFDQNNKIRIEEEEEEKMITTTINNVVMTNGGGGGGDTITRPIRKNGILFAADGPSNSEFSFAAELEQLRKQSTISHRSHKASIFGNSGRMSIRHGGKLSLGAFTSTNDDFIRKMSSVSMEEQQSSESGDGIDKPPESDAIPHINLGKNFQARVKKWADRAISAEEREAIPDRDERLFNTSSIEHISQQSLAAFETLACSVAIPKPGRNKELALHILAENRGNLQAAVMDLLRCDTLDWEQYPAIYNSRYVDVDSWSPEEIASFQDAIYKSEKDFQQVSSELGNRSISECVAFYYTWKKACPDDYRKLRNLRRKRQLLEQQLDLSSFDIRQQQQKHPLKRMRCGIDNLINTNLGNENELLLKEKITTEEEIEELSDSESDITNPSLLNVNIHGGMECSPLRKISPQQQQQPIAPIPISLSNINRELNGNGGGISSIDQLSVLLGNQQNTSFNSNCSNNSTNSTTNSNYPWLHGTDGIFPSPSSSTTSNNNETTHFGNHLVDGVLLSGLETTTTELIETIGRNNNNNHFGPYKNRGQHGNGVIAKKGAQPQADGFFHCRLCEKRFEKVKSLNAHMKSHAMKARAEAEALQKNQQQQSSLPFPFPTKKDILTSHSSLTNSQEANKAVAAAAAAAAAASNNPIAGALVASSVALGMPPGLPSAQAAMAALNSLGRQIQQQQQGCQQQQQQPFTCANSSFGLLRNMLQYGQQQVAAAAVAANDAAAQTNSVTAASRWPGL